MPIVLVILLVAARIFYFQPFILPRHDTFIAYSTFYYFYNHLYYYHVFPQWMPKVTYGIPSLFFQFFSLSPVSYAVILLGQIFKVTDVMFLFRITLVLEEVVFVLGMYYLAKAILKERWGALAIGLASMISLETYTNVFFNFRIFYFVPWAVLFLWDFAAKKEPRYFWMLALAFTAGCMGNGVYIPIVIFYLLVLMALVVCIGEKIRPVLFWPKDIWSKWMAGVTIILVLTYGLLTAKCAQDLTLLIRDSQAQNSERVFLTYGHTLNVMELFNQLFRMKDIYSKVGAGIDNTLYVGPVIGILGLAGVVLCRDILGASAAAGLLFTMLFSHGGWPDKFFYHLPGMSLFRHIGLTAPLVKVMLLVTAAFGLKYLSALWPPAWDKWIKAAMITVVLIETGIFQHALIRDYPQVDMYIPQKVSVFDHVRPALFDITRQDDPQDVRRLMMTMVQKYGRGRNYITMFNALDFDTCHTDARVDLVEKSVADTWKKTQDQAPNYDKIAGCEGHPKCLLLYQLPSGAGEDVYDYAVPFEAHAEHFDADHVRFSLSSVAMPGWFYYADAFHPGWKASVNGTAAKVRSTADGFKAVWIDTQAKNLEFSFFDWTIAGLQYLLCVGAILGLGLLVLKCGVYG